MTLAYIYIFWVVASDICHPSCRWKSDMQLRMGAGGNAEGLDSHDAMEDLSSDAFGLEHLAAEINAAEQDTASDLMQRRDHAAQFDKDGDGDGDAAEKKRVHKKDMVADEDEWFLKFNQLKVGMAAVVSKNEAKAVQECRKCTVRSSGATTMFWGTKTEKELLRKNGLGKQVVIKEVDK